MDGLGGLKTDLVSTETSSMRKQHSTANGTYRPEPRLGFIHLKNAVKRGFNFVQTSDIEKVCLFIEKNVV